MGPSRQSFSPLVIRQVFSPERSSTPESEELDENDAEIHDSITQRQERRYFFVTGVLPH